MFPDAVVSHLPRVGFDHSPILVKCVGGQQDQGNKAFRFQAAWLTHLEFKQVVGSSWNKEASLKENTTSMASVLGNWNRETFGNIHRKKRRLLARLDGIQRALDVYWNHRLVMLGVKLKEEFDEVLAHEELLWFQKSREEWIRSGDRNTKYYHASTMVRRTRNKIRALQSDSGELLTEGNGLAEHVQEFYSTLFRKDEVCDLSIALRGMFTVLEPPIRNAMISPFSVADVKEALFDMDPFKASRPDGLHAGFYQRLWETVGDSVVSFALQFFETGALPEGLNDTLLVLIPKVEHPENVRQLRPISLCNVSYKVLTKVMTNRLKKFLPDIIGNHQSSFVPKRQITDNILLYQEVLHSLKKKQGSLGYMVIKVDLEKAYDRLSWDFIRDTLAEVGFDNVWIRNLMMCIESPIMSILFNGKKLPCFFSERGIRQGDSISPYIFVLCIERLSHFIAQATSEGRWRGI